MNTMLLKPDWLTDAAWPFTTTSVDAGRGPVAVSERGTGRPLLFVHTGLWSFIWRDVMLDLSRDFRCISVDAPSNGLSATVRSGRATLQESAHAIYAVIKELALDDVTLVVHDLGGPAALAAVSCAPEIVRGIVAVNTFAWKPRNASLSAMLGVMGSAPMREISVRTGWVAKLTATSFGVGRAFAGSDRDAFVRGMNARGVRAFHDYMASAKDSVDVYRRAEAALDALRDVPVLTIFGERNDPFHFQAEWHRRFPAAEQVVVPNGNHFPMCDDPGLVAASIRGWMR